MRYIKSRYEKDSRDMVYRFYIAEAVKILTTNTANFAGGTTMTKRLSDLYNYKADNRTSEEIISNIKNKLGGA